MSKFRLQTILKKFSDTNQTEYDVSNILNVESVKSITDMDLTLTAGEDKSFTFDNINMLYIVSEKNVELKYDENDAIVLSSGKTAIVTSSVGFTSFYVKNLIADETNAISIYIIEY